MKKIETGSKFVFIFTLVLVYVILFEFILPVNWVLPKPTLLFESFLAVWGDYNLLIAMGITTTIVYLSLIISFFIVSILSPVLIHISFNNPNILYKLRVFRFFPAFFFAILFAYWFGTSLIAEFCFAIFSTLILLVIAHIGETKNADHNYFLVAINLGLSKKDIYSKVISKSILPNYFNSFQKIHYYLWVLVMIYEFITGINGFGGVYKIALTYNDFAGLFSIAIIIALLIWLGSIVIKQIREKVYFWES